MPTTTQRLWTPCLKIGFCLASIVVMGTGTPIFGHSSALAASPAEATRPQRVQWGFQQPMDRFFSEGIAAGDINSDGQTDLVVGPFWIEGPAFETRHQIQPGEPVDPHGYAPHFFSYTVDLNGDGRVDILHIGFPGQAAYWLENPGIADPNESTSM